MARWREIKKSKTKHPFKKTQKEYIDGLCTSPFNRIKAFITDMFLIMMPIMYITTYIIMDGKDSFQASEIARWITMIVYGAIIVAFWVKKGQTPGFKAYNLVLINDKTKQTLSIVQATLRYFMFLVSAVSVLGFFISFFRKDKKMLQDIVMQTSVIRIEENITK